MDRGLIAEPRLLRAVEGGGEGGGIERIGAQAAATHLLGLTPIFQAQPDVLLMFFEGVAENGLVGSRKASGDALGEPVGRKPQRERWPR